MSILTKAISQMIAVVSPRRAVQYELERAAYDLYVKKRSLTGGYDASKPGGPNQLWRPGNKSGTSENLTGAPLLKARARDLSRNNPYVRGGKRKIIANTVGSDLSVVFSIKNQNGESDKELNAYLNSSFKQWAKNAMLDGRSFHDSCEMVVDSEFTDGEVLVNFAVEQRAVGNPLRLQILENDYLNASAGTYGIDYDSTGKPSKYHVYSKHPGDFARFAAAITLQSTEISADNMFLVYKADRPSSYRGVTELAPIVMGMYSIDQLESAEMDAIRAASAFGLVVTSMFSTELMERLKFQPDAAIPGSDLTNRQQYVEGGQILYLQPGESATSFKNDRPNQNLIPFIDKILYGSSSSIGISNEELTNDYSKVNYSSARQSALVARTIYKSRRLHLQRQYLNKVADKWLQFEFLSGRVPGYSLSDYIRNIAKFESKRWTFPGFDWIDPLKEIKAAEIELRLGLNSRENICIEKNRDFSEIAAELAEEKKMMLDLNIWEEEIQDNLAEALLNAEE